MAPASSALRAANPPLPLSPRRQGPGILTGSGWAQTRIWHRWMVKMAWERELCTFIWVLAVVRDRAPCLRHWISWEGGGGQVPPNHHGHPARPDP